MVGVKVFHDTLKLVLRDCGSEGAEDVVQLGDGDLAVAVGVKAGEDGLQFVHVTKVNRGFGGGSFSVWIGCHCLTERKKEKEGRSCCVNKKTLVFSFFGYFHNFSD